MTSGAPPAPGGMHNRIWGALIANGFSRVIRIAEQLVLVPLLLAGWGIEIYGEWIALISIAMFVGIANFGIGHTAASEIVLQHARNDNAAATTTFVTSMLATTFAIVVSLSLLIAIVSVADIKLLVSIRALDSGDARLIIVVLSLAILFGFYSEPLGGVLNAAIGAAVPNFIYAATKAIEIGAIGTAIYFGARPLSIAALMVLASLANVAILVAVSVVFVPWLSFRPSNFRLEVISQNARTAFGFFAIFVSFNIFGVHVPRLIVSHELGAIALAAFTIMMTYSRTARNAATMISQAMQVEVGRTWAGGDKERSGRLVEAMVNNALSAVVVLLAIELTMAPLVIPAWTHGQVTVDWKLLIALAAVALVGAYFDAIFIAAAALNRVGKIAIWYSTGLAAALGTSFAFLPLTGSVSTLGILMLLPELAGAWSATDIISHATGRFRIRLFSTLGSLPKLGT